jgi:hypothetical protein
MTEREENSASNSVLRVVGLLLIRIGVFVAEIGCTLVGTHLRRRN